MPNKYTQFAFGIPDDVINEKKSELCVRSKESYIKKYGEVEGKKKWDEYVNKQKYTKSFEYWSRKNGKTIKEYEEYNKGRACTLNNMISRYGEHEGRKKWKAYVDRQRYTVTRQYFIKEYGNDEGERIYKNFIDARNRVGPYSNISQDFFDSLMSVSVFSNDEIFYATHGGEKEIYTKSGRLYYLDYYDKTLGVCVEFNGNSFHPKVGEYKETDIFKNPFGEEFNVGDLWEKEQIRKNELLNEFGIRTIIVWEDEYKRNKQKCLCDTINEILNTNKKLNIYGLYEEVALF